MNKSDFTACELRNENDDLSQQITVLSNEKKELNKYTEGILKNHRYSENKKKTDLQVKMRYFTSKIWFLRDENLTLSKDIQRQKQVIRDTEGRMKELENEKATLSLRVKELQKDDQSFRQESADIHSTREPKRDFLKERDEMEQKIQALQKNIQQPWKISE